MSLRKRSEVWLHFDEIIAENACCPVNKSFLSYKILFVQFVEFIVENFFKFKQILKVFLFVTKIKDI